MKIYSVIQIKCSLTSYFKKMSKRSLTYQQTAYLSDGRVANISKSFCLQDGAENQLSSYV